MAGGWTRSDTSKYLEGDEEIFYGFMPPRNLRKAPNLKWVQLYSAGVDHLIGHPIMRSNVMITTSSGIHAVPIGEFAVMMMLALARRLPPMFRMQNRSEWPAQRTKRFAGSELRGKTLGIIGYGSIGREAARIAKQGFGMRILAMTRTGRKTDLGYIQRDTGDPEGKIPDAWFRHRHLLKQLRESDFVLVTAPLTNETRNMIGEAEFSAMKPDAYIVNVARGGVIDQDALVRALKEHRIAGAGLDVFATEPLPLRSKLWKLENVIITPHVSGGTPNYNDRAVDLFIDNLSRYLNGASLLNLVDKSMQY
jgi:phosphoglycerate dehydrogenase-like enzyme